MSDNNSTEDVLRSELEKLGAREFEVVALTVEPKRGLAALHYALSKGAEHPIAYATKVFSNADWQPTAEKARFETNRAVDVRCATCGGDRFVEVATRQPQQSAWMREKGITPSPLPIEEMAPCPDCNSGADTSFRRADGTQFRSPDPAKVREMMGS